MSKLYPVIVLRPILIYMGLAFPLLVRIYVMYNKNEGTIDFGEFFSSKVTWLIIVISACIFALDPSLLWFEVES